MSRRYSAFFKATHCKHKGLREMSKKPRQFAISSCTRESTTAGIEITAAGGNAVDAAVGVAYTLLVSAIMMTSAGGGGFAVVRTPDGEVEAIDFFDCMPGKGVDMDNYRQIAKPKKVHLDSGLGYDVMIGHACVSVPGVTKGLDLLLKRHGTMPLKEIIQPAINFARTGTRFNKNLYDFFSDSAEKIHWSTEYARKIFSKPDGSMPEIGTLIKQHDLANTLELIAEQGSDVIYKGEIAEAIVKEVRGGGGLVTMEDLNTYEAIVKKPTCTTYRGKQIWTNPPPAVGGVTLAEILNILSLKEFGKYLSPQDVAFIGKAQRQALFDKFTKYIDPNTNEEVSKELLSPEYAAEIYQKILPPAHTTHLSVIDESGYAVGLTMSQGYGSGVMIPGTGILMTNSMGEMDLTPMGYLKNDPGDRLISGMSPTIVYDKDSEDLLVIGSAGSSRIPTSIAHVIMNIADFDMSLHEAISAPRCHYEDNDFAIEKGLEVDKSLLDDKTKVFVFNDPVRFFGGTNCARYKKGHLMEASNDPRRSGSAQTVIT